jgi:mono/diheme cytochrome c family protein
MPVPLRAVTSLGCIGLIAFVLLGTGACTPDTHARERIPAEGPWNEGVHIEADPQVRGDVAQGRTLLLEGDFMTCGIPYALWEDPLFRPLISSAFGAAGGTAPTIPDRSGPNELMPYFLNVFETPDTGTEVLNANCLTCHGATFNGELVLGMGNTAADFTRQGITGVELGDDLLDSLGLDDDEREQLERMFQRAGVLAPFSNMRTVGHNPAEMYAVVLMAHHDRETLAWQDEPLIPIEVVDHDGEPIADPLVTSKPPPWWRAHKKNALFYNGMARGDHRGTMALASSVCVDSVDRAQQVDDQFRHIQAFVDSVRPPPYPFSIDDGLARRGEDVFINNCAGCHGTYGANEADHWYPNLLLPLDVILTDPVVAEAGVVHAPHLVSWYNDSFYGQVTRMEPDDPFPGYMPPPLDGIWAAAPYLHNGSVPTVELVLDSGSRPTRWKRLDYDSTHFDEEALGWPFEEVPYPQAEAPEEERKHIYDTTYFSQSNSGHTFGDHLSADDRRAVIEYLKTL